MKIAFSNYENTRHYKDSGVLMKILIIGGTKFIGPYVVKKLLNLGHDIIIFNRGLSNFEIPERVKFIKGDRKFLTDFKKQFINLKPDLVIDMIARYEKDAIDLISVFGEIVDRIVMISSQDVYRSYGVFLGTEESLPDNNPDFENSSLRTVLYPYRDKNFDKDDGKWKWQNYYEKILIEKTIVECKIIDTTILRLPMVYGPGDYQHRIYPYLRRMDDGRRAIILDEKLAKWRMTVGYVKNIADGIAMSVTNERARGQIFNLGEVETPTYLQWISRIKRLAKWSGEIKVFQNNKLPEKFQFNYKTSQNLISDSTKIRKMLNYKEDITISDSMTKTILWERENPPVDIVNEEFDYEMEDEILNNINTGVK